MKSKHLLLMLLLALLAPWAANAQETLTVYDGTDGSSNIPFYGTYADTQGSDAECIIPAEALADMTGGSITAMKFYIKSAAAAAWTGTHQVYVGEVSSTTLTGITGPSSFTVVMTASFDATGSELTVTFDSPYTYEGGNLLIGTYCSVAGNWKSATFYGMSQAENTAWYRNNGTASGSGVKFIPKTTFTYEPAQQGGDVCEKPSTCEVSDITATSAILTWGGGSGVYNVEVKGGSYADWTRVLEGTSLTTTTLTLDPITSYQARVQSVCNGSTPTSGWKTASFTTPCGAEPLNYVYGFEEDAPFSCWTAISGSVTRISGTTHADSYRLDFRGTTSNMIAFPPIDAATNTLRVEFWTRPESNGGNSGKFAVGYMTDLSDASTFVAVETYNSTTWTSLDYVKKTVDLVSAPANAFIVFRQFDCSTNYYWYVDDVTVKPMPSCVAPTALNADASTNSADLSWTANSGESSWTLYYKKTTDENYTEVANVTENPYTLTGLTAATNYQFYVVANCSATDNSEFSDVATFATECEAIPAVGYSANFDDYAAGNNVLPICWSYINTTTNSSYAVYPRIYPNSNWNTYAHSAPNCLYLYSYAYYSGGSTTYDPQPQYAIMPEMNDLAGKQITLWARGYNAASTFMVGTMSDPADASTFTAVTGSPDNPAAMTTSYQEYTFYIPSTTTDRYVAIMIEAANSSRTNNGVYIDDIEFSVAPTCWQPQNLTASDVTNESATLTWNRHAMGDETAWVLQYSTDNTFATATTVNVNTNPTFTIDGALAATTTYYVRVKPACDNEGNLWSETINFTTEASCMVPNQLAISNVTAHEATLTWNGNNDHFVVERGAFDNTGAPTAVTVMNEGFESGSLPEGWTNEGTGTWTVGSGDGNTSGAHAGSYNAKRIESTGSGVSTYLVTPAMNLGGYASATINLYYMNTPWSSDIDDFGVYYRVNGGEWNELFSVSTGHSSWTEMGTVELPNLANNYQIGFKYYDGYGYGVAIDDIVIEAMEYPIAWTVVDNNVPYDANANTYTFENLDPETTYMVRVSGKCGEVTTEPSAYVPFTTTIACPAPTNLAYANVTAHTADLTWNVNGNPTTNYKLTKEYDETSVEDNIVVTITNGVASYTLEGLNGETEYTVSVVANCGTDDGTSLPSNEVSFTTQISCQKPTALTASDETTSSIKLHWTANGGESDWVVAHKIEGATVFTEVTVTESELDVDGKYNLTGLTDGKTYTLKVRANCGGTDGLSTWSDEIVYATEASCATPTDITVSDVNGHGATISWTDPTVAGKSYIVMVASENMALNVDFENNSIPSNFTNDATYPWYVYSGTDCSTLAMRSGNYNVNNSSSSIEVTVNVTAASTLSFDFWSRGEGTSTYWDKSKFYIDDVQQFERGKTSAWENYSAPIAVGSHTLKWVYTKDNTTHETGDCFYVDNIKITAGASEYVERPATTEHSLVIDDLDPETTYYVKVKGDCGSATSPESDVESFTTLTACNVPTNLTHDDESVTAHTATLSWTENNGATAWQVVYSKANINNSEETVDIDENDVNIDGTTITYTLTGLDGETSYIVRVKSNCGGVHNDMSVESSSTNFITLPACYPVGDVITSDITAYSVTVHWTDAHNAGAYVIKQGENVLDGTTTPSVVIDAENLEAVISGLEPEHTYTNGTFKVFADCGLEGMSATGTNVPYFQTEPSCYPVTNVTITGMTTTSVTFTWEDTHNPEAYVIKEGDVVLTGETAHSVVIDAENYTATISGLDENETYAAGTFKVFADCGTTDGQSAGVNVPAFTTPCSANTTFPWTEDFNSLSVANSIPDCWNNDEGTTSTASYKWCYTTGTGNGGCNGTSHDNSNCVRFNSYTGSHVNYLKSIPLSLPNDQPMQLKFWYKNPAGGDFSVYISTDGGATHETALATGLTGVSDWTEHDPISLSAYAGQEVVLVFKGTSNNGYGNAHIYLDDVTVEEAPACAAPSALNATAITNNSATLSWTANSGETAWTLYYKKTTDENYTEVTENVTNPYTLTVEASTEYIFYVVANCSETEESEPSATFTFTTQCNPITVDADNPFTENFDAGTLPPTDCWNTISNGAYNWTINTGQNHNEGGSASAYSGYHGDIYLIMPTLAIANNEGPVKLTFWSYNTYTSDYDKNSVVLLDGANENELWSPTSVSQSWEETTIDLSAYKGQTITLAFKYEGDNAHGWYVDDVWVGYLPSYTKAVESGKWYAISSPVNEPAVADVVNLTDGDYDFYRYDEASATWENYKADHSDFTTFENGRGYIYRRSGNKNLTFYGFENSGASYSLTADRTDDLKGFNLLGNPFANSYTYGGNCYALTEKGTWMAMTNYTIPVCEAILVKVNTTTNYVFSPATKSAPKAVEALALTVSGNGYEDVTYAMLEEGEGLTKVAHLAEDAPALSIPVDGSNYAIAYLGYEVESFPLTLNAQAGEYTIALNNQISGLSYCHLLDKETGKETDLLKGAYTFKANGNSNRFTVLLNASLENGEIAIWNGNSWIVNGEGTLQVFDVMGRRVYNQEVAGQSSLNTDELATGVYVIRLGEKSQKIVVK